MKRIAIIALMLVVATQSANYKSLFGNSAHALRSEGDLNKCYKLSCKSLGESCGLGSSSKMTVRKCDTHGAYCTGKVNGVCKARGDDGDFCMDDDECKEGLTCKFNWCKRKGKKGEGCTEDSDCDSSLRLSCSNKSICDNRNYPGSICTDTNECPVGTYCYSGEGSSEKNCREYPGHGDYCTGEPGEYCNRALLNCHNNACAYKYFTEDLGGQCTYSIDCKHGLVCYSGRCTIRGKLKSNIECGTDDKKTNRCPDGYSCMCNYKKGKNYCAKIPTSDELFDRMKELFGDKNVFELTPREMDIADWSVLTFNRDFWDFCSGSRFSALSALVLFAFLALFA